MRLRASPSWRVCIRPIWRDSSRILPATCRSRARILTKSRATTLKSRASICRIRYSLIHQLGIDASYADGTMLWKYEFNSREQIGEWHFALSAGGEYTFSGVFGSVADVGLLAECLFDDRGENASQLDLIPPVAATASSPAFRNDVFVGLRVSFNDVQRPQILAGLASDLDGRGLTYSLKAERRLGETWKLNLEWRGYSGAPADDVLHVLRNEDSVRLALAHYFWRARSLI